MPDRRTFLKSAGAMGIATCLPRALFAEGHAPAVITSKKLPPIITHGVATGDIGGDSAVIWSRADRPARMIVEYAASESFRNARRIVGPATLKTDDFSARVDLRGLPAGARLHYRVSFQDLHNSGVVSEGVAGSFQTASTDRRDIRFLWSGDTAGQGWGINPEWGGMKIYETMRRLQPDFFIHCGDYIYADGPIPAEKTLTDGSIWRNLTVEGKTKVAETLDEFRANYRYNLMDEHIRRFNAEVAQLVQWDDHETTNNWYPGKVLEADNRYRVKSVDLLAARARRAFLEYAPIRRNCVDSERIYRRFAMGPLLEVFMLDMRSYRGPNSANRERVRSRATALLGGHQIQWLKQSLLNSRATWKVIASDMPLGLMVRDGQSAFENVANGNGDPLGRELELADLLRFIAHKRIHNVVWVTADVHYTAAHYYDPAIARFGDFTPFWEFVSGPLNAGTFGPNELDDTFGPQVMFSKAPEAGQSNLPPSAGLQFFGEVAVKGDTEAMTVNLRDILGQILFTVDLTPQESRRPVLEGTSARV